MDTINTREAKRAGVFLLCGLYVLALAALMTPRGMGQQSTLSGALRTTNSPSAGLYLRTDGTVYFWDAPTAQATNAIANIGGFGSNTTLKGVIFSDLTAGYPLYIGATGNITNRSTLQFQPTNSLLTDASGTGIVTNGNAGQLAVSGGKLTIITNAATTNGVGWFGRIDNTFMTNRTPYWVTEAGGAFDLERWHYYVPYEIQRLDVGSPFELVQVRMNTNTGAGFRAIYLAPSDFSDRTVLQVKDMATATTATNWPFVSMLYGASGYEWKFAETFMFNSQNFVYLTNSAGGSNFVFGTTQGSNVLRGTTVSLDSSAIWFPSLTGNTYSNVPLVMNGFGKLQAPGGTPSATTYLRGDGTYATPPGGSASPGGNAGAIQFNEAGAFAGTNYFYYNRTNNYLQIAGAGGSLFLDAENNRLTTELNTDVISLTVGQSATDGIIVDPTTLKAIYPGRKGIDWGYSSKPWSNVIGQQLWLVGQVGGAAPTLKLTHTNQNATTEITVPDDWTQTNKIVLAFKNPTVGDVFKIQAVSAASGGLMTLTVTNGVDNNSGGGSGIATNADQFAANVTLNIKNGALLTNISSRGLTLPNVTASRVAVFNASGNLTNSPAVDTTEIEYLDGVTSAIQTQFAGKMNGASNSTQFGASTTLTIKNTPYFTNVTELGTLQAANVNVTNGFAIGYTNAGGNTNLTLDWSGPRDFVCQPSNTFTLLFTNQPIGGLGALSKSVTVWVYNTNAAAIGVTWPAGVDWRGAAPGIITGITNVFTFSFSGTNTYGFAGQDLTTGSGPYVLATNATVSGLTNQLVLVSKGDLYSVSNTYLNSVTLTNNIGRVVQTTTGTGGANTNFTFLCDRSVYYIDGGTTNVNIVAVMGYSTTIEYNLRIVATNRTGTSRTLSLGASTNNWINAQLYTGADAPPYTITNSQALQLSISILGTNATVAALHTALPTN